MSGHVKPTAEQIARVYEQHRLNGLACTCMAWNAAGWSLSNAHDGHALHVAEAVLALWPGKTEAEVRADECERIAATGSSGFDLNPTRLGHGDSDTWWAGYLRRLDQFWQDRVRARAAKHREASR